MDGTIEYYKLLLATVQTTSRTATATTVTYQQYYAEAIEI